jgi:hypothetical protein
MNRPIVRAEDFVEAFNSSVTVAEVCKKTGMKPSSVTARACRYRTKFGIPLKVMGRRPRKMTPRVVERLKKIALKALGEED